VSRQFLGRINNDGFLRLYPATNPDKFICEQLDIIVLDIPIGYGRVFGRLSPNRFPFRVIGTISFVSITQGIIKTYDLEYVRNSLEVPVNAIGFFYNLGLDGVIKAEPTAIYTKKIPKTS